MAMVKSAAILFLISICVQTNVIAQIGRVGINTTTPMAMLHVKDSSVVFTGPDTIVSPYPSPPVSGSGTRMMWYAGKAAFRMGTTHGQQWAKDSIGVNSVAMGYDTRASGFSAFAAGLNSKADGLASVSLGTDSRASGVHAYAIGYQGIASAVFSSVLGSYSVASGISSTALGAHNRSSGSEASTLGVGLIANAPRMVAVGAWNDTTYSVCSCTDDPAFMVGIGLENTFRKSGMTILRSGYTGIGTIAPASKLHVRNNSTGGAFSNSSIAILESASPSVLQFSNFNSQEAAIFSGNQNTMMRSALFFKPDSSLHFFTGGNILSFKVDKSGNTITTGEIRRESTGTANLVPICFGSISAAGTILSGSGNFSVAATSPGFYEITITGESYANGSYSTSATPVSSNPRMVSIANNSGHLVVQIFNGSAALIDSAFHFVVYKQ